MSLLISVIILQAGRIANSPDPRGPGLSAYRRRSAYWIIRVTVWVWVCPPPVPVIVRVYVPGAACFCTVTVRVDVPVPPALSATGLGLNELDVRLGSPLTLRLTLPVKLLSEPRL